MPMWRDRITFARQVPSKLRTFPTVREFKEQRTETVLVSGLSPTSPVPCQLPESDWRKSVSFPGVLTVQVPRAAKPEVPCSSSNPWKSPGSDDRVRSAVAQRSVSLPVQPSRGRDGCFGARQLWAFDGSPSIVRMQDPTRLAGQARLRCEACPN